MGKLKRNKSYDTEMIKDFLQHLLWEMRVLHFESTGPVGRFNPELTASLKPYFQRRGRHLFPVHEVVADHGTPEEEAVAAGELIRMRHAKQAKEAIEHLEALQEVFEIALHCASKPAGVVWRIPIASISSDGYMVSETTILPDGSDLPFNGR